MSTQQSRSVPTWMHGNRPPWELVLMLLVVVGGLVVQVLGHFALGALLVIAVCVWGFVSERWLPRPQR